MQYPGSAVVLFGYGQLGGQRVQGCRRTSFGHKIISLVFVLASESCVHGDKGRGLVSRRRGLVVSGSGLVVSGRGFVTSW